MMTQPKKLIEVAMPIKEISAESVRDGRIQHGHISSLHKWWARRPLPVCRAVIFASLVPDPLDKNCPKVFKDAVEILLGKKTNVGDPYKPYEDIPYTSAVDVMEDNLRNRLLMFIGKFSEKYIHNEKVGKKTDSKSQLSENSLIKWESKNNEEIISKARKLIWVAHNANGNSTIETLFQQFDYHLNAIKHAEEDLYNTVNRHFCSKSVQEKENKLSKAIDNFLFKMPIVFDPFAGGGAIPLEAARLGCKSFGNDINPVAHIIQKGSVEFPQKFGKKIIFSKSEFEKVYGIKAWQELPQDIKIIKEGEACAVIIANRLVFDINYYTNKILTKVEKEVGHLYPKDKYGNSPYGYYWSRVGFCSNPSCRAEVPLLKQFYLVNTSSKQVFLDPEIQGTKINFTIKHGRINKEGWIRSRNLICPCCGNITDNEELKRQSNEGLFKLRLLAVIDDAKGGRTYRLPSLQDISASSNIDYSLEINEEIVKGDSRSLWLTLWGVKTWGDMFTPRQIKVMGCVLEQLNKMKSDINPDENEYNKALFTYLAIWVDRLAARMTSFGLIDVGRETIVDPFGRQGIAMIFDFPEINLFKMEQVSWITRIIESECFDISGYCINATSGDKEQFNEKSITACVTDPPYYDAIPYADLSDFFYVWLKRLLANYYPLNFATPLTPKSDECTALKHHHNNNMELAKVHFENKLAQILDAIEHQTTEIVSIMFAHQSTEAWSTLCNSILGARMNITGSWANDTELTAALKTDKAFLSSSVTVACKPSQSVGIGEFKSVKKAIEETVTTEVNELYKLGFRGADLLTACFGKAVSEFGKFDKVEKANGSLVTVNDLLELAKESAFNALLKGFNGDDFTKFYIGWLQLYGFGESDFDDAAKFSRVGLTINVSDLFSHNVFIKHGNKQELSGYKERLATNHRIGEDRNGFIIDQVHKAMGLFAGTNRQALLEFLNKTGSSPDSSFWRVITSLCEVLPQGSDDFKQAKGLLLNKESLIRECKNLQQSSTSQGQLF